MNVRSILCKALAESGCVYVMIYELWVRQCGSLSVPDTPLPCHLRRRASDRLRLLSMGLTCRMKQYISRRSYKKKSHMMIGDSGTGNPEKET